MRSITRKCIFRINIGDRFVATTDDDTSYTIIAGGKRIASSSRALKLNQYSDTYIAAESTGYYALYNFKGKKLTKTYQNAFDESVRTFTATGLTTRNTSTSAVTRTARPRCCSA